MISSNLNSDSENLFNDELSFRDFLIMLWDGKYIILAITFLSAIFSVYYSLSQPNIYTSSALLSPANSSSGGSSGLSSRYGGLASLAGISLDSGEVSDVGLGIEILKSRVFIEDFIKRRDILVPLFAMEYWDSESTEIILNKEIFDVESQKWKGSWPNGIPSYQDAYQKFMQMMKVSQNKKTGLVTVSITHQSPVLSQKWTSWLVEDINSSMRNRVVTEAENSILFLQREIESTALAELRLMFFRMIEEQTKTVMLGNVRPEYLFTTIDPAIIPEQKVGPIRYQICIIGTIIGAIFSVLILFIRRFGPNLFRKNQ